MHPWERPSGAAAALAVFVVLAAGLWAASPARADDGGTSLPAPRVRQVQPPAVPRPPVRPVQPPAAPRPPVRQVPPPAAPRPPGGPQPRFAPPRSATPVPRPATRDPVEEAEEFPALSMRPEDQPMVRDIRFEGTALFADESLQVLMRLKVGARLDPVLLDEDIERLYRYFEDVRVTQERVSGGVVLHFLVQENPLVVELNVYGADAIGENEIRNMMSTKVGFPLFPYALASDAEDLVEVYRAQGYYFAQTPEPVITTVGGGGRRVDFTVVEGPEVQVQKILFRGNSCILRKDMLEVIETKEKGFIPFLSTATFRMDVLLEDLVALKRLYEDAGYLDAEVVLDDLRFSDDKSRVCITISIIEHQPYCVGRIEVEIDRLEAGTPGAPPPADAQFFDKARILELLGLRPGMRYSGKTESAGRERIEKAYFRRSYIDAWIPPLERRGRERRNVVDLLLKVEEGAKSRVRELAIVGNEYTRDKVLRREARVSPGGYVNRSELDRTLKRMKRLGYFDRVTMQIENVKCRDGTVQKGWKDVTYEVIEASTGSLNFGVGLSTDGGVLGSITFTKQNFDIARWPRSFGELTSRRAFTGAGQRFNVYLAPGTITSQFQLGFEEPHLFGTNLGLGVNAYKRLTYWQDWTADRLGYGLSLSYPVFRDVEDRYRLNSRLRWRHENVDLTRVALNAIPGAYLFRGPNEVRALSFELAFAYVDDLVKPKRRSNSTARFEYAGGVLGGDIDILKSSLSHEQWFSVYTDDEGRRHSLTLRAEIGWAQAFDGTPEVPPFERYYMGGNRLRGFRFRGAGPHINGEPTGGEWVVLTSAEYLIPIIKDVGGIVAFVDAGTLATNLNAPDAGLWRVSVGGGLRLKVPMLGPTPLAFDFGFPLMFQDGDEKTLISFSVGRDF